MVLSLPCEVYDVIACMHARSLFPVEWSYRLFMDKHVRYGIRMQQVKLMLLNKRFREAVKAVWIRFTSIYVTLWHDNFETSLMRSLSRAQENPNTFALIRLTVSVCVLSDEDVRSRLQRFNTVWLEHANQVHVVGMCIDTMYYSSDDVFALLHGVMSSVEPTLRFVKFIRFDTVVRNLGNLTFPAVTELLLSGLEPFAGAMNTLYGRWLDILVRAFPNVRHVGLGPIRPIELHRWPSLQSVALNPDTVTSVSPYLHDLHEFLLASDRVLRLVVFASYEQDYMRHLPGMIRHFVPDHDLRRYKVTPNLYPRVPDPAARFDLTVYDQLRDCLTDGWFKAESTQLCASQEEVARFVRARSDYRYSRGLYNDSDIENDSDT